MMLPKSTPPLHLFYSYAHEDEEFRNQLEKHLSVLKREGLIQEWHDREIGAGHEWEEAISENLEAADVILLLVSADFLASDYCYEKEMRRALEKHEMSRARVIPVILREADWRAAPFGKLQALPKGAKPVVGWQDRDEAWTDVAKGIRREIGWLLAERERKLLEEIRPEKFEKGILSLGDMRDGAELLFDLIERNETFEPEVLIAVNQGGMAAAAIMSRRWRKPVGVMYTAVEGGTRVVRNISLPCEIRPLAGPSDHKVELQLQPPQPKQILVVDPKLKTGNSAERIRGILQQAYGQNQNIDIRYAIVLAYGGWVPSRWEVIYPAPSAPYQWPVRFKHKDLQVYVAYYTDDDGHPDRIREELRPGWRG